MTEAEWRGCEDPDEMLWFLDRYLSERKKRLLAIACCRHIWHLLTDERSRRAVEVAERWADGMATDAEYLQARENAWKVCEESVGEETRHPPGVCRSGYCVALAAFGATGGDSVIETLGEAAQGVASQFEPDVEAYTRARKGVEAAQRTLIDDLFASPFRRVAIDPAWLSWDEGAVVRLARKIYEERCFGQLPRVADLLEQAGCRDEGILGHCRQLREHVRGCWVVDCLLGKEPPLKGGLSVREGWQTCPDPEPLLGLLRGKGSDRQWRLFAVACCRRIRRLMDDPRCLGAVEVAERFADGLATADELTAIRAAVEEGCGEARWEAWSAEAEANFCHTPEYCAVVATWKATCAASAAVLAEADEAYRTKPEPGWCRPWGCGDFAAQAVAAATESAARGGMSILHPPEAGKVTRYEEQAWQAAILRDVFGNDLLNVTADPRWLSWNDGTITNLAQTIYAENAFDRLPVLADALLDAGCDNDDLLDHCRSPGPHVRGCWAVDLLRGNEVK